VVKEYEHRARTGVHLRNLLSIKAAGGKFKSRVDLFPGDVELLDDFFYGGPGFEIFRTRQKPAYGCP